MGGADGISFGKGNSIDFKGFNGIKEDSFTTDDKKKQKLNKAIFQRYDQNKDGVLDKGDLQVLIDDIKLAAKKYGNSDNLGKQEAQDYLTGTLGLEEGEFSRDDLAEILEMINADTDTIESAETDQKGNTTIKYKPDKNGQTQTDTYNNKVLTTQVIENEGLKRTITYENGIKSKEVIDKKGERPITIEYETIDNETVEKCRYQEQGSVREYLDGNNKVKTKITNKGSGIIERVEYDVRQRGGGVADCTYINNELTKKVIKDGNDVVSTTDYTYNGDNVTAITTETGGRRIKDVSSKDGNTLYGRFEIDDNGQPKDTVYEVDRENDTWYGIVQAKYNQTDHATIMEIVHILKDNAGVNYNSKEIPDTITLPPSIKLKDGATVELHDIEAQIDERHNVPKHINVQNAQNIPENLTVSQEQKIFDMSTLSDITPQDTITIPEDMKTHDVNAEIEKYPQDASKANRTIQEKDGNYVVYDDEGYPSTVYSQDPNKKGGENSEVMEFYFANGTLSNLAIYKDNKKYIYNSISNLEGVYDDVYNDDADIRYNADGKLKYCQVRKYDNTENRNVVGSYSYYAESNTKDYEKYDLDNNGRELAKYKYENGNLVGITKYELDNAGNVTREIEYDAEGNVKSFIETQYRKKNGVDKQIRYNADGTVDDYSVNKYHADGHTTYRYDRNGDMYD